MKRLPRGYVENVGNRQRGVQVSGAGDGGKHVQNHPDIGTGLLDGFRLHMRGWSEIDIADAIGNGLHDLLHDHQQQVQNRGNHVLVGGGGVIAEKIGNHLRCCEGRENWSIEGY